MLSDRRREFTREELYALVWETPISRLAKSFGLSNVGLRKICVRHNIPTPPLGYWAKLAHGKKVRRPALVAEGCIGARVIRIVGRGGAAMTPTIEAGQAAAIAANGLHPPIIVADDRPVRFHPVAAATARALRAAKTDQDGFKKSDSNDSVGITVGADASDRALRIIDAFARAIEERGHVFEPRAGGVRLIVNDVPFEWRFHEIKEKTAHEPTSHEMNAQANMEAERARWRIEYLRPPKAYPTWDYSPSGRLAMTFKDTTLAYWRREALIGAWRDRKGGRLEGDLDDAMKTLVAAAVAIRHRLAEEAGQKRLESEERERRRQAEACRERQRKRRDYLIEMSEQYARYRRLNDFAVHLKQEIGHGQEQQTDRLVEEMGQLLRTMEAGFSREAIERAVTRLDLFTEDDLRGLPDAVEDC